MLEKKALTKSMKWPHSGYLSQMTIAFLGTYHTWDLGSAPSRKDQSRVFVSVAGDKCLLEKIGLCVQFLFLRTNK